MCDYCWRAYEWVGVSRSVVGKNDPCLDVITMCDGCRKTFNALRNTIPASYLLPKPGTYPVKIFRRFKPEDGATQQTIHDITEHIMKNVSARFAEHVTIHAFAITPVGGRAPAAVWVLIDLPCFVEVDVELLSVLFDALPGGSERWIVKTPMGEQCIAFFRMCWWRTKMEFHAYDTLPVLT
ncbi:uncharacterized protein BDV17DRAFT_289903 [Aspergillus undulatus]|uniref:uncharacterized protein n=1 Tax=Aspergillus undulatus TaxID=1810928 RepID=UPI003CCD045C